MALSSPESPVPPRWVVINRTENPSEEHEELNKMAHGVVAESRRFVLLVEFSFTTCLDTRQPGTVFKKLGTRQSEILTNFLEIARLIPLRT